MHSSSKAAALLVLIGLLVWAWLQLAPLMGGPPSRAIVKKSPGLTAAQRLAQDALPELLRLLDTHKNLPHSASLWVRVEGTEGPEQVRVDAPRFSLGGLVGTVAEVPAGSALQRGARFSVATRDIVDWSFRAKDQTVKGNLLACYRLHVGDVDVALLERHAQQPTLCEWADAYRVSRGLQPWFN